MAAQPPWLAEFAMTTKPTLSFWQIWNMCFGFLGIQFGFALQNANVSRIFQTLQQPCNNRQQPGHPLSVEMSMPRNLASAIGKSWLIARPIGRNPCFPNRQIPPFDE